MTDTLADEWSDYAEFCQIMGFTLASWQRVEEAHFTFFQKMLGGPSAEVCSVIYHGTPSFEGRRVLVDRVAIFFKMPDDARTEWIAIHKAIEPAAANRNKIAHYVVDSDVLGQEEHDDGSITFTISPHRLRPSKVNIVDRLKGRTPEKPGHNVSRNELFEYMKDFQNLTARINALTRKLFPPQQQPE
jgi:hypothetical protein